MLVAQEKKGFSSINHPRKSVIFMRGGSAAHGRWRTKKKSASGTGVPAGGKDSAAERRTPAGTPVPLFPFIQDGAAAGRDGTRRGGQESEAVIFGRVPNPLRRAWRSAMTVFFAGIGLIPANGAVLVAFCVVHPINPLCCPSPCSVYDSAKVADFLDEAEQAWQKVEQCRQIADRYLSLVTTFGPNGPLATELRRVPDSVSGVLKTFKASFPQMLNPGDLGNPRAVAEILKTALFEPKSLDAVKLTDSVGRVGLRSASMADEAVNALATGLHGYKRLTDVATDGGRQTVSASKAANVRTDLAAGSSTRQALIDNLAGLEELLSSWAATEATAAAATHTAPLDKLPASSTAAQNSPLAVSLQAETDRLDKLRQMRLAVNQLDVTTSALTSLHNERHAALVMLAQYPGLRNTVASDDAAIQFRAADAAAAVSLLAQIFTDGDATFQLAQKQLSALDTTGWKDNATKIQAANTAAQAVVQAIIANPQVYGTVRSDPSAATTENDRSIRLAEALSNSFSSWLEDDKLERFWAPLRRDADAAISSLDQRLKEISDRRGFDISGSAAAEGENALLVQFDQQLQQMPISGQQGATDDQKNTLATYLAAFQDAAAAIRSDGAAGRFVTVRWPS